MVMNPSLRRLIRTFGKEGRRHTGREGGTEGGRKERGREEGEREEGEREEQYMQVPLRAFISSVSQWGGGGGGAGRGEAMR